MDPIGTTLSSNTTQQNLTVEINAAHTSATNATNDMNNENLSTTTHMQASTPMSKWVTTPKMFQALQHHDNIWAIGVTYHGPLDFLDNQETFNAILPNPKPVYLVPLKNGVRSITSLTDTIWRLIDEGHLFYSAIFYVLIMLAQPLSMTNIR